MACSVQGVLLVFIITALMILAYAADRCNSGLSSAACTIQDAMSGACGRAGKMLTSLCVVVYCFGTTITFLSTSSIQQISKDQWSDTSVLLIFKTHFSCPFSYHRWSVRPCSELSVRSGFLHAVVHVKNLYNDSFLCSPHTTNVLLSKNRLPTSTKHSGKVNLTAIC